jgi:HK97 family phage major capsid protein
MAVSSVELREKRAGIVAQARTITDKAGAEDRELTAEESEAFDRHMEAVDKMKVEIDRHEKLEAAEADLEAAVERVGRPLAGESRGERQGRELATVADRQRGDFRHWMASGEVRESLRPNQGRAVAEYRDTVIGTDAKGGYLIAPVQVTADLVRTISDQVFVRRLATIRTVTEAKKLGIRKLVTHMADANWTTEVGAVTEDTTMAFDRRDLEPYLLTKLAKMSLRTMYLATDAEGIIRDELAYKFAITQEKAFLTGTGSSQPLGVFVASASGISTGRDVAAAAINAVAADDLINTKYNLRSGYLNSRTLAWIVHRDLVKAVRKLKDTTNQYLWSPGLAQGDPDRILDIPFYMSEYAPNTFTTGLYVAILGDFRFYWVAEVQDLVIQRLVELYSGTNEVGFIGRIWVDGAPILEEAFSRLKLA